MNENTEERKIVTGFVGQRPAKLDPDGYQKPPIIQELTIRPVYRRAYEIANWRTFQKSAEATIPRRVELYDLYDDILIDGHLQSVVEKRILAVTNAEWVFLDKNGNEVEAINDWIDTPEFETLLTEIINSRLWGYTMLEFDFHADGTIGVFNIPRKHIRPELGIISIEQSGNTGINVREGIYAETILEVGKEKDLGKLLCAAPYVIYKRGNTGDWAQFIEIFGRPIIDAVWDGYDEKQRLLLLKAIDEMGGGAQIVRPAGTSLNFVQGGSNNPTGELNKTFHDTLNEEISKLILGQTETTESSASSGYAQASVHADTEDDINLSDIKFVRRILNRRVVQILQANGINTDGTFSLKEDNSEKLTKEQELNIDLRLYTEVLLPMSDDYFYKKYGIEKPENYNELKAEMKAKAQAAQQPPMNFADPFRNAPKANGAKTISLRDLYADCDCGCQTPQRDFITLADKPSDDNFIKKVFEGELKDGQIHDDYYFNVAKKLTDAVLKGLGGSDFKASDPRNTIKAYLDQNIYAFSAAKSLAKMQEYKSKLTDESGNVVSYGAFRNAVQPIDQEFDDNHLRTEYNSAIGSAQMAKKWQSLSKYSKLEYRTVGDNKVRASHKALNGKVFATNDPIWNEIYPPNGWNCRCTVVPAPDSARAISGTSPIARAAKSEAKITPYFNRNVGKQVLIFDDGHPMMRALPKTPDGDVELKAQENYNLPSAKVLMARKDLPTQPKEMSEEETIKWWNENAKNDVIPVKTQDGLSVDLGKNFADKLINAPTENRKDRTSYAHSIIDVVQNPDEVWSHRHRGKLQNVYIKYYDGKPYVVAIKNKSGRMEFETFFKDSNPEKKRAGVLKYKK